MVEHPRLSVIETYSEGRLRRTSYFADYIEGENISDLVQNLKRDHNHLVALGTEYSNMPLEESNILIEGTHENNPEVWLDRPFTPSELELFALELSKPLPNR